jgi:general secretion pathway protein H
MRARSLESGFTLIEILMVVFIIGLSSSLVIMSLPERVSGLQQDAFVLQRDVDALANRAILTGIPHALEFNGRAYEGRAHQAGKWVSILGLRREISRDVALRVKGGGPLSGTKARIVFDPTGAPTGAQLSLSARGERFDIALNNNMSEQVR